MLLNGLDLKSCYMNNSLSENIYNYNSLVFIYVDANSLTLILTRVYSTYMEARLPNLDFTEMGTMETITHILYFDEDIFYPLPCYVKKSWNGLVGKEPCRG